MEKSSTDRLAAYGERLASCTVLAVGAALIFRFAERLWLGPWVPGAVAVALWLFAFYLVIYSNSKLAVALAPSTGRLWFRAAIAGVIAGALWLVCMYFIVASVFAATASLPSN